MNIRVSLAAAGVLLLLATPHARQPGDRLAQWMAAVEAHEPGHFGTGAIAVATWTGAELTAVVLDAKQRAREQRTRRDAANDLLLRGAAFHTDIARLIPYDVVRRSPTQQQIFVVMDGREQGTRFVSLHWGLGRSLLDAVSPAPAAHPGVLRWYRDTAGELLRMRSLAEAAVHLPKARSIFPADPRLLFLSGVLYERFSSPAMQAAATAVVAGHRGAIAVNSAKAELGRAERFFRETLDVEPGHLEARVRHGRVLGALGRHAQAAECLRAAIEGGASGALLYLSELFSGEQADALGRPAEARAHFDRASALYPRAQSPRLALSQLSRRAGDRPGAWRELLGVAALPADERQREDPWWAYFDVR